MRRTEVKCDRCGASKELRTKNDIIISFARIDLWGIGQHRTEAPQKMDLCESCFQKFVNFLESESDEK